MSTCKVTVWVAVCDCCAETSEDQGIKNCYGYSSEDALIAALGGNVGWEETEGGLYCYQCFVHRLNPPDEHEHD